VPQSAPVADQLPGTDTSALSAAVTETSVPQSAPVTDQLPGTDTTGTDTNALSPAVTEKSVPQSALVADQLPGTDISALSAAVTSMHCQPLSQRRQCLSRHQ